MSTPIVSPIAAAVAMSTREIATLCDKEHSNVIRDMKVVAYQCGIDVSNFSCLYTAGNGQQQAEYLLPYPLAAVMLVRYNYKLSLALMERIDEQTLRQFIRGLAHSAHYLYVTKIGSLFKVGVSAHPSQRANRLRGGLIATYGPFPSLRQAMEAERVVLAVTIESAYSGEQMLPSGDSELRMTDPRAAITSLYGYLAEGV